MRPGGGLKQEAADAVEALEDTMIDREVVGLLVIVSNVMLALGVFLALHDSCSASNVAVLKICFAQN